MPISTESEGEKPTCIVHEMRNDTDWVNLKRTIVRAPQIFKQKVNCGVQLPPDVDYDKLHDEFNSMLDRIKTLEAEVLKYTTHVRSHLNHSVHIGEALAKVFDPALRYDDKDASLSSNPCYDEEGKKYKLSRYYIERNKIMMDYISPDLDIITNNVVIPLTRVIALTKSVKKFVKEREYALLDANRYLNDFQSLNSKDKTLLTLIQQQNLIRYEKNHELSKLKFEQINEQLKKDLPQFFTMAYKLIEPLFVILYFLQLSINYRMFQQLDKLPDSETKSKIKDVTPEDFNSNISTEFNMLHKSAKGLIESLSLLRSPLAFHYSQNQASNYQQDTHEASFKPQNLSEASTDMHCVARYAYEAQQEGDLSFNKGARLRIVDKGLGDWWKGELDNGMVGLFPCNYVTLIESTS